MKTKKRGPGRPKGSKNAKKKYEPIKVLREKNTARMMAALMLLNAFEGVFDYICKK